MSIPPDQAALMFAGVPTNPYELKQYALMTLGAPVIKIEVTDAQCYLRIQDAVDKFMQRHYDGVVETWEPYQVDVADVQRGYCNVGTRWTAITGIIDPMKDNMQATGDEFDDLNFRLANSDFFNYTWSMSSDMVTTWVLFQEKLQLIKQYFAPSRRFRHNGTVGRLELYGNDWRQVGYPFVIQGYKALDARNISDQSIDKRLYSNEWLKRYTVALIGRQWGQNVSKYDGVQLTGGVTMNGQALFDRFDARVKELEDELVTKLEGPIDFMMG